MCYREARNSPTSRRSRVAHHRKPADETELCGTVATRKEAGATSAVIKTAIIVIHCGPSVTVGYMPQYKKCVVTNSYALHSILSLSARQSPELATILPGLACLLGTFCPGRNRGQSHSEAMRGWPGPLDAKRVGVRVPPGSMPLRVRAGARDACLDF